MEQGEGNMYGYDENDDISDGISNRGYRHDVSYVLTRT